MVRGISYQGLSYQDAQLDMLIYKQIQNNEINWEKVTKEPDPNHSANNFVSNLCDLIKDITINPWKRSFLWSTFLGFSVSLEKVRFETKLLALWLE